ncbi:metallophosphoesterase family protein [Cypionkella sinensis]|uniref:Metallophosphoesterase family protein n=1 Tax=Cypionkella sinensis TaxID=1756043 RepID=A0ABV7J4R1_9RHOB
MMRIVHLTDLHFGLHRADLVEPLQAAILENRPDLVVVSGDLTQRARSGQFRAAMDFLRGLGIALMLIPGNHDLPLFNPFARLLNPFGAYRRGAAREMTPVMQVGRVRLFGVNTADPLQWRGGVARSDEIARICASLRAGPQDTFNILVSHHPFEEPPGFERGETRNGLEATQQLTEAGLHVVLSGHLHHWNIGLGVSAQASRPLLHIQTGTALCSRIGERDHGFCVLEVEPATLRATRWLVAEDRAQFVPEAPALFGYEKGLWHKFA